MAKATPVEGLRPEMPLAIAGRELLLARLADLRRHETALLHGRDPEAVHDMRVAARRLRVAIRLLGREPLRRLEPRVKALQDALGVVRDAQVQRAWIDAQHARGADRMLLTRLRTTLMREEAKGARALETALGRWIRRDVPRIVRALGKVRRGDRLGGKSLRTAVKALLAKVERRARRMHERPSSTRAHSLRKGVKTLRYAGELVDRGLPRRLAREVDRWAALQEGLGELHDLDVRIERLGAFGEAPMLERLRRDREKLATRLLRRTRRRSP